MDRGTLEGFLSPLCCCCSTAAVHARQFWGISVAPLLLVHQPRRFWFQAPRLSIFALFAQSSPVRAKIPLLSEKPTKTSKETIKPRFYPINFLKRIRKGGYTKCRNRAIKHPQTYLLVVLEQNQNKQTKRNTMESKSKKKIRKAHDKSFKPLGDP